MQCLTTKGLLHERHQSKDVVLAKYGRKVGREKLGMGLGEKDISNSQ